MKKLTFLIFVIFTSLSIAQPKYDIKVIAIGIGEKNPTFNESLFPNIEFYYTPELISQAELDETGKSVVSLFGGSTREVFEGKPEILAEWWNELDLRNHAIVFDKNGVGTWQGKLDNEEDELIECEGEGEESSLEDTFEFLLDDNETMEFDKDKEFDYEDNDCLIKRKMIDFSVVTPDGASKSIREAVENGKTTMVMFFQISKDVDMNAMEKAEKEESLSSFLGEVTQGMASEGWMNMFKRIELEFYNNEVKTDHHE